MERDDDMTRKDAAEKVFDYIKNNNFTPTNIKYENGYFIFDMGEDGVVHFSIKGLHGWKFAMWINTNEEELKNENGDDYPAIRFFCQHKLNIDKFKPSRSYFLEEYSLKDIDSTSDWKFYGIRDMLQMIKRHPFIAFTMDCYEDRYYNKSYILCYLDIKIYRIKKRIKEWWKDTCVKIWHGFKVWFINKYKVVDKAELIDMNDNGWKVHPRYIMKIHFSVISEDEVTQQKAEIKMLDMWFRKNKYRNMDLELTRDGINGRYSYKIV